MKIRMIGGMDFFLDNNQKINKKRLISERIYQKNQVWSTDNGR